MRILITGASGFIGKHLVKALIKEKYINEKQGKNNEDRRKNKNIIYALSNNFSGLDEFRENKRIKIFKCDITDKKDLTRIINKIKPNAIVHLAAYSNPARDFKLLENALKINFFGTANLLEACNKIDYDILVNISTGELYFGNNVPFNEKMPINPVSPYSVSKAAAERLCRIYAQKYNKNIISLRLALVYGPGQEENKFLPYIIKHAMNNIPVIITKGEQKRDYIYVDDVISAINNAINIKNKKMIKGQIINIGTGKQFKLNDIINAIENISNKKIKIKKIIDYRDNELWEYSLNCDKADKLLNWKPKISLHEGIKKIMDYEEKKCLV